MEKERERDKKKKKSTICRRKRTRRRRGRGKKKGGVKKVRKDKRVWLERGGSKDISQFVPGSQSLFWTCLIMHRPLKIKLLQ